MKEKFMSVLAGMCIGIMSASALPAFPDGELTPIAGADSESAAAPVLKKCEPVKSMRTLSENPDWTDWETLGVCHISGSLLSVFNNTIGYAINMDGTAMRRDNRNAPEEAQLALSGLIDGFDLILDMDTRTGRCTFPNQELPIPQTQYPDQGFYENWHIRGGSGYYSSVSRTLSLTNVWLLISDGMGFPCALSVVVEGGERADFYFRLNDENNGIFHSTQNEAVIGIGGRTPVVKRIRYLTTWRQPITYSMLDEVIAGTSGVEMEGEGIPLQFAGRPGLHYIVAVGLAENGEYTGVYRTMNVTSNVPDGHTWVDAGRGRMTDPVMMNLFCNGMGSRMQILEPLVETGLMLDVDVQTAEDAPGLYRVVNPYSPSSPFNEYYVFYNVAQNESYMIYDARHKCPSDDDYYIVFDATDPGMVTVDNRPDGHSGVSTVVDVQNMRMENGLISGTWNYYGNDIEFRLELPGFVDYSLQWGEQSIDGYEVTCGDGVVKLRYADLSQERVAELGYGQNILDHPELLSPDELHDAQIADGHSALIPLLSDAEGFRYICVFACDGDGNVRESDLTSYEKDGDTVWGSFVTDRYSAFFSSINALGSYNVRVSYRRSLNGYKEQYEVTPLVNGGEYMLITVDLSSYAGDGLPCPATVKTFVTGVESGYGEVMKGEQLGDAWYHPDAGVFELSMHYYISLGSFGVFNDILRLNGVSIPLISVIENGQWDMPGGNVVLDLVVGCEGIRNYAKSIVPGHLTEDEIEACMKQLEATPAFARVSPEYAKIQYEVEPGDYTVVAVGFNDLGETVAGSYLYVSDIYADANWIPSGKCLYTDDVVNSVNPNNPPQPYSVDVEASVVKPGLYRLVNPYGPAWPEFNSSWAVDTDNHYLMVDVSNPTMVTIPMSRLGVNKGQGEMYLSDSPYMPAAGSMIDDIVTFANPGTLQLSIRTGGLYDNVRIMGANLGGAFRIDLSEVIASVDEIGVNPSVEGPAEYYNLQGMRVMEPGAGIYIVRRGNKVTKEYIRR